MEIFVVVIVLTESTLQAFVHFKWHFGFSLAGVFEYFCDPTFHVLLF